MEKLRDVLKRELNETTFCVGYMCGRDGLNVFVRLSREREFSNAEQFIICGKLLMNYLRKL